MATTRKTGAWGGEFEEVRERVYTIHHSMLFGMIQWDEVVHADRISNTRMLRVKTSDTPDLVEVNGEEYVPRVKVSMVGDVRAMP